MGKHDWYRNTTWTEDIKDAFFSRLKRSKTTFNKAQYLRIQALYLQQTGKKENILGALKLLDILFSDCPEPLGLASAHLQRAQCFEWLGDYDSALNAYRESIKAERTSRGIRVLAGLNFAWFVVRRGLTQHYDEALSSVEMNEPDFIFPYQQFMFFSVFAIIGDHYGKKENAKRFARNALDAMGKTESPLRYHKKVGLVENPDKVVVEKLMRITRSPNRMLHWLKKFRKPKSAI